MIIEILETKDKMYEVYLISIERRELIAIVSTLEEAKQINQKDWR